MPVESGGRELLERAELPLFWAAVGLVFLSFHLGSYPLLWVVVWCFAAGVLCSYTLFRSIPRVPNLLFHLVDPRRERPPAASVAQGESNLCPVCAQRNCRRHPNQKAREFLQPWDGLAVPSTVDTALTEFLEIVLDRFICSWQRNLLHDDAFVDEIRISIRYTAAIILRRAKMIDIPSLITGKVMQAAAAHFHLCLQAKEKLPQGVDIAQLESAVLQELGDHTHVALRGKTGELRYFRQLLSSAMPHLFPPHGTDCRVMKQLVQELFAAQVFLPAMHFVSKPDFINKVLTIVFNKDSRQHWTVGPMPRDVPFLGAFAQRRSPTFSPLRPSLGSMLNSQTELYSFMQFMKTQQSISVLQLFLSLKELKPAVEKPSTDHPESLLKDLSSLYDSYLSPSAPTRIQLHPDPSPILADLLSPPPSSSPSSPAQRWARVRESRIIQQLYLQVLQLLEENYYPLYCHSEQFFSKYLQKRANGRRSLPEEKRPTPRMERAAEKRQLKARSLLSAPSMEDINSDSRSEHSDSESGLFESTVWVPTPSKVQIVDHETRTGDFKPYTVYVILTWWEGEDGHAKTVKVKRRFKEFDELDTRLRHFYADLTLPLLPSKRTLRNMDSAFVASRGRELENYLKSVIQLPRIQNSQLLASFLKDTSDPTLFMPDSMGEKAGKMIKSVPGIRNKEKSLLLTDFLQKLVQSTDVPPPQASEEMMHKVTMATKEWQEKTEAYAEQLEDDLSESEATGIKPWLRPVVLPEPLQLEGVMDLLVYMALRLFKVSRVQMSVLLLVKLLGQRTVETYIHHFVAKKVALMEQERVMVELIELVRDNLFFRSSSPSTTDERDLEWRALNQLLRYPPEIAVAALGEERYREGILVLFKCLQCHRLNKQLFYTLLDVIVLELFPELDTHHGNQTTPPH